MAHFTLLIEAAGPVVSAFATVSAERRTALQTAGLAVPPPVAIRALIDTGASCTCVDPGVIAALAIPPTGTVPMHTPSTGGTPQMMDQFDLGLLIPGPAGQTPLAFPTIPVVASHLAVQGIQALIGRDILRSCVLHYNGAVSPSGIFTLAY